MHICAHICTHGLLMVCQASYCRDAVLEIIMTLSLMALTVHPFPLLIATQYFHCTKWPQCHSKCFQIIPFLHIVNYSTAFPTPAFTVPLFLPITSVFNHRSQHLKLLIKKHYTQLLQQAVRLVESLRLEKTVKIIESNHNIKLWKATTSPPLFFF